MLAKLELLKIAEEEIVNLKKYYKRSREKVREREKKIEELQDCIRRLERGDNKMITGRQEVHLTLELRIHRDEGDPFVVFETNPGEYTRNLNKTEVSLLITSLEHWINTGKLFEYE